MKTLIFTGLISINSLAADIIISAEKISKNLNSSTNNVTFISSSDIQRNGWSTISEVLQSQPGVYLTGFGSGNNIQSLRMNGTQRGYSKIIIDSIEYNDPTDIDNSFQINQLDLTNIESIEILKGSQSTIYGSDAIGGVIKITTKFDSQKSTSLNLSHGSYNLNSLDYQTNGQSAQGVKYSLQSTAQSSDGISSYNEDRTKGAEADSFSKVSVLGNLEKKVSNFKLRFQSHFLKSSTEIDNYGSDLKDEDHSNFKLINYFFSIEKKAFDGQLRNELSLSTSEIQRDSQGEYPTTNKGQERKINFSMTHFINSNMTNLYGLEYQTLKSNDIFDFSNQVTKSNSNTSIFIASLGNFKNINLDLSARLENNSAFDEKITYKAGVSKNISNFLIALNYATGYKSPTIYQLHGGSSNLSLKPIDSIYKDLHLKYEQLDFLKYSLTIFQYDFKNQIIYKNNHYENISKSQIIGIENALELALSKNFLLNLGTTFQSTENKETGKYLERSPRLLIKSSLSYIGTIASTIEHLYIGERNDSGRLPSYSLINFTFNYHSFKFNLNNVLNKEYEDIRTYGTYGRNYILSYKLNL